MLSKKIAALQEQRGALVVAMQAALALAEAEKRLFTPEEQKKFDEDEKQVGLIDAQIANLEKAEKLAATQAKPAVEPTKEKAPAPEGNPAVEAAVALAMAKYGDLARTKAVASEQKGLRLARAAIAHAVTRNPMLAGDYAARRWKDTPEVAHFIRAAVDPMSVDETTNSAYLTTTNEMQSEFIELLRAATIMGKVPARRLQFGEDQVITIPKMTAGASGGYVGEANSIKAQRMTIGQLKLTPSKLAVIVPVTNELLTKSNPSVEMMIRDDIVEGSARTADGVFFGTAAAGSGAPAGILNGVAATTLAATTATPSVTEVTDSVRVLIQALRNANVPMARPVWVMHPRTKEFLRFQRTTDSWAWRDEINAGVLSGMPIIDSTTLSTSLGVSTDSSFLALMDGSLLIIAEDMGVIIDASSEASIQADDAPATPPTGVVSAFQQDMTFIRLRLKHTWARRIDAGVAHGLVKF